MPEPTPAYIGLPSDGVGKKARTLEITALQASGGTTTVEMQVVSIADETGRVLDLGDTNARLDRVIELLEQLPLAFKLMED